MFSVPKLILYWVQSSANIHRIRAAGAKRTAGRWIEQIRRCPWDSIKIGHRSIRQIRNRPEQPLGIRMLCLIKNLFFASALHNFSRIHNIDTVCHICHDTHVMCDEDDGGIHSILQSIGDGASGSSSPNALIRSSTLDISKTPFNHYSISLQFFPNKAGSYHIEALLNAPDPSAYQFLYIRE